MALQQSQLLVSAEPGDRLRHRALSVSRCRRSTTSSRRASSRTARRARRRRRRSSNSSRVVPRVAYAFTAPQPVRYLGILISRMMRVDAATVALDIVPVKAAPPDMRGTSTLQQQINRINAATAIRRSARATRCARRSMPTSGQESRGRDAIGTAAEVSAPRIPD